MRIVLTRHGQSAISNNKHPNIKKFSSWVNEYNSLGIKVDQLIPDKTLELVSQCETVVCSNLVRSIESVFALGFKEINYVMPELREINWQSLGYASSSISSEVWLSIFGLFPLIKGSTDGESIKQVQRRIKPAIDSLISNESNNGNILIVGHGISNILIANYLRKNGWKGPLVPNLKNWGASVYEYRHNKLLKRTQTVGCARSSQIITNYI